MPILLIRNGSVITMNEKRTVYAPGWVWIKDDRIAAVGPGHPQDGLASHAERVIDAIHMAVMPGLINGHTHLEQTFMRGLADGKPLLEWLKVVQPIQSVMTAEDVRLACLLGLVENMRCGVTSVVQHHKVVTSARHIEAAAKAAEQVGMRLQLIRGWRDLGETREAPDAIMDGLSWLHEKWHHGANGRITVGFGPIAPWRCSSGTVRRTLAAARQWGLVTHTHIAETADEIGSTCQNTGMRPVQWLHSLGALGPDMQMVHCVHLNGIDRELIAESGATVVHCPTSNMYLASGIAPVRPMLDRGITVALGTDGPASGHTQDLLETLKIATLLVRVSTRSASALLPGEALRMVTVNGARLLGRQDLGRIVVGASADLILINLNTARAVPVHSPESAVVHGASGPDVHTVIVDGRVLLDAGRVTSIDEASLLTECRETAAQVLRRAGVVLT